MLACARRQRLVVERTFADEGASRNNGKTDPQAIDDTAQQGDDLVAEERRK